MEPADVELFLAKLSLREDTPPEVDAFVAWASARFPDGPRLQLLAGYRPIQEDLDQAFLLPTLEEAGLALPEPLDALRTLARHEMRRVVAEEISPEEGAGNIDMYVSSSPVEHQVVAAIPEIWNFCVYRGYLRAAGDVGESGWYAEVEGDRQSRICAWGRSRCASRPSRKRVSRTRSSYRHSMSSMGAAPRLTRLPS